MPQTTAVTTEVEDVLRAWARAQAPERDFDSDRVFFFVQPVQHREGVIFVPGELVLGHPATGEVATQAKARGFPAPLAIWSFELKRELIVPPGLVRPERAERESERAEPAAAPK